MDFQSADLMCAFCPVFIKGARIKRSRLFI